MGNKFLKDYARSEKLSLTDDAVREKKVGVSEERLCKKILSETDLFHDGRHNLKKSIAGGGDLTTLMASSNINLPTITAVKGKKRWDKGIGW
ncbi:hypothetical protein TNCV_3072111 [Trichonephila clavipes]|nr:hypothetical protein TNCV_3072111 [Trichonephila clavipes]